MNQVVFDSIGIDAPMIFHAEGIAAHTLQFTGGQVLDVRLRGNARTAS